VFAQSNAFLLAPLARAVDAAAGRGVLAFDLFAGAGFLTLGLARRFEQVVALESDAVAVADLVANLRAAGRSEVEVIAQPLEVALAQGSLAGRRPDVIVVDPPRTGLPEGTSDALVDMAPERIVYLSCDPATQARDAAFLLGGGYDLDHLEAFDLFPQTPHVESLAVFGFRDNRRIRVR
jgi:tRNA/tmRNA/rRNA uracil-C5-methylase (TrmA/RlmC/RlmD family)